MKDKKFLIFRIIIVFVALLLLGYIEYYQRSQIIKENKIKEENKKIVINDETIINAAKIYVNDHINYYKDLLDNNIEFRIDTDSLVKNKLLDNNDNFKGYVKITNNNYSYIKCDNMLIDNLNDKDYINGLNNENKPYDLKYIYRGDNPNNYILYNNILYRIIGITNNNNLKIINTNNKTIDKWGLSRDINYLKTDKKIDDIDNKNIFYVGYVSSKLNSIDTIMKNEKRNNTYTISSPILYYNYSYVNISDIINAAKTCTYDKIDSININNCSSYLLNMLDNTYTSNTLENNMVYKINMNKEVVGSKIENNINIKEVIYVSSLNKYVSGNGEKDNPYVIE